MSAWQLQEAKAKFSEFLDAALTEGPQIVTRRGVEAAVLVPMEDWRRMQLASRPNIKELLLAGPQFDLVLPKRGRWKRRTPLHFSDSDFQ